MSTGDGRRTRAAPDGVAARVSLDDEQSDVAVDLPGLAGLAAAVLEAEGVGAPCELALRLVDEDTMAGLNRLHLDGEGPTDVLAFPLDEPGQEAPGMPVLLGDVVVCPAVAARQAAERSGRTGDELALLVIHGVLHVLGMDHAEPGEAAAMEARQRQLLAVLHREVEG